jgi:hypothetical protein
MWVERGARKEGVMSDVDDMVVRLREGAEGCEEDGDVCFEVGVVAVTAPVGGVSEPCAIRYQSITRHTISGLRTFLDVDEDQSSRYCRHDRERRNQSKA